MDKVCTCRASPSVDKWELFCLPQGDWDAGRLGGHAEGGGCSRGSASRAPLPLVLHRRCLCGADTWCSLGGSQGREGCSPLGVPGAVCVNLAP